MYIRVQPEYINPIRERGLTGRTLLSLDESASRPCIGLRPRFWQPGAFFVKRALSFDTHRVAPELDDARWRDQVYWKGRAAGHLRYKARTSSSSHLDL